jgi:hypothetical protein
MPRSLRAYCLAILILLPLCPCFSARQAFADRGWDYGSVVCRGAEALVRFTSASNDDSPGFEDVKTPAGADFDDVSVDDPSSCLLSDGRRVRLKHVGFGDGSRNGWCGADETQIFSLWIGEAKVYSREIFHHKCGRPYDIASIWFHGATLTECRLIASDQMGSQDSTFGCHDESRRLTHATSEKEQLGTLQLARFAPDMASFCGGLVSRQSLWWHPIPPDSWSAYAGASVEVIADSGLPGNTLNLFDEAKELSFGSKDDVLKIYPVFRDEPSLFAGAFWVVIDDKTELDDWRGLPISVNNPPDKIVRKARERGIRVFAGDQTAYGSISEVRINVLNRDGVTWMHAKPGFGASYDLSDIILRPTREGTMQEVCAFKSIPPI